MLPEHPCELLVPAAVRPGQNRETDDVGAFVDGHAGNLLGSPMHAAVGDSHPASRKVRE